MSLRNSKDVSKHLSNMLKTQGRPNPPGPNSEIFRQDRKRNFPSAPKIIRQGRKMDFPSAPNSNGRKQLQSSKADKTQSSDRAETEAFRQRRIIAGASESDSFRERRILDSPPSGEVCAQSVKWEELSGESAQARGNHRGSPNHSVPVHELLMQRHNEVIATGGENEW
ncbi:hypothetical protein J6590_077391 [Homalodisca vitripennis]|nr:hypothetical protein J6590_077391 [Homalodisca vitripennis]